MDLQTFLRALRKFWWLILLLAALGGGGGYAYASQQIPVYESSVTFVGITHPTSDSANPLAGEQYAQSRVATYADVVSTQRLADLILKQSPNLGVDVDFLTQHINGSARTDTVLLYVTVDDTDKDRSLVVARIVAQVFPQMVRDIESDSGSKAALLSFDVVDGPLTTPGPISPKTKLLIALGFAAGLALGIAFAILRELLDTTVRSADLLRVLTQAPVLGVVTTEPEGQRGPMIIANRARSERAEMYRQLRTNLQFIDVADPAKVMVVSSSMPGEGKSTTSINLAVAFAESGRRVLLVDADLRRPKIAEYLGLEGSVGLTNVLAGQVELDDVVQPWGERSMLVLPSGSIPPNPSELLGSTQMDILVGQLRDRFDMVIIDTPPLLPVTDGAVAAVHSDGAVIVVRYGVARRAGVARAIESLRAVDARVLGTILNGAPHKGVDAQDRYGEYGYFPEQGRSGKRRLGSLFRRSRKGDRKPQREGRSARSKSSTPVGNTTGRTAAPAATSRVAAAEGGKHERATVITPDIDGQVDTPSEDQVTADDQVAADDRATVTADSPAVDVSGDGEIAETPDGEPVEVSDGGADVETDEITDEDGADEDGADEDDADEDDADVGDADESEPDVGDTDAGDADAGDADAGDADAGEPGESEPDGGDAREGEPDESGPDAGGRGEDDARPDPHLEESEPERERWSSGTNGATRQVWRSPDVEETHEIWRISGDDTQEIATFPNGSGARNDPDGTADDGADRTSDTGDNADEPRDDQSRTGRRTRRRPMRGRTGQRGPKRTG